MPDKEPWGGHSRRALSTIDRFLNGRGGSARFRAAVMLVFGLWLLLVHVFAAAAAVLVVAVVLALLGRRPDRRDSGT
jgi:uncharacterized membrane protein YccF (DUF307 family)